MGSDSQNFVYYTSYSTHLLKPSINSLDLSSASFYAENEVSKVVAIRNWHPLSKWLVLFTVALSPPSLITKAPIWIRRHLENVVTFMSHVLFLKNISIKLWPNIYSSLKHIFSTFTNNLNKLNKVWWLECPCTWWEKSHDCITKMGFTLPERVTYFSQRFHSLVHLEPASKLQLHLHTQFWGIESNI